MLRLNKSNTAQDVAIYLDTTSSIDSLILDYQQDYDLSSGSIDLDVASTKGKYRIGIISGSEMPANSGQYTIDIFSGSFEPAIWSTTPNTYASVDSVWSNFGTFQRSSDLLRTIRAYVSGSNDVVFNNYVSPNESGSYTTYNG